METHQKHLLRYKQLLEAENSPFVNELPQVNVRSDNEYRRVEKDKFTSVVKSRKRDGKREDFACGNKSSVKYKVNTQNQIIKHHKVNVWH